MISNIIIPNQRLITNNDLISYERFSGNLGPASLVGVHAPGAMHGVHSTQHRVGHCQRPPAGCAATRGRRRHGPPLVLRSPATPVPERYA